MSGLSLPAQLPGSRRVLKRKKRMFICVIRYEYENGSRKLIGLIPVDISCSF
jgi:hypothetical protein